MPDISSGSLNFKSSMDNEQMNSAIEETLRRIQGLSDGTASAGRSMESSMAISATSIRDALAKAGEQCELHERQIESLKNEYSDLLKQYNAADESGNSTAAEAINKKMQAIQKEIGLRKQLLNETRDASDALENEASKLEKNAVATEEVSQKHTTLRIKIRELKSQMADLVTNGISEQSDAYRKLRDELGRLTDLQGDISGQGRILANDEAKVAGIVSGLSGLSGGFQAVAGTAALFVGENENLQRVMTKLQSLMSITMGLQQVQQTLNKDSAFMLTTIGGLKEWWNKLTAQGITEQVEETAATVANTSTIGINAAVISENTAARTANTIATSANAGASSANAGAIGAETVAAGAGTVANWSLAGSFQAIGAAIKSIPVFGWIAAGIGALITAFAIFSDKTDAATDKIKKNTEAAKENEKQLSAQEEIAKEIGNSSDESIAKIESLTAIIHSNNASLDQRRRAISALKKIIPGYNAEISNEGRIIRENTQAIYGYIAALEKRAMATAAQKKLEQLSTLELNNRLNQKKLQDDISKNQDVINDANNRKSQLDADRKNPNVAQADATRVVTNAAIQEQIDVTGAKAELSKANRNMDEAKKQQIEINKKKSDILAFISENNLYDDIISLSTDKPSNKKTKIETEEERYKKHLDNMRKLYEQYYKWVNSGDEIVRNSAKTEFAGLLDQGISYIDYMKKQRDALLDIDADKRTKSQTKQLTMLNDAISGEAKNTVLESFNKELSAQLSNAKGIIDMLNIIEQRRKELANDGSDLDNAKKDVIDEAQTKVDKQAESDYKSLLTDYQTYEEQRDSIRKSFASKRELAEKNGNTSILDTLAQMEQNALKKVNFDELKVSPEYIRAFEDLDFASSATLQNLIDRFEAVKNSAGENMNPEDVREYVQAIEQMVDELNTRDPFGQLVKGYQDLHTAGTELKTAERELQQIRDEGGAGSDREKQAIEKVNTAKDKYIRKNKDVRNSEKQLSSQIGDVINALKGIGEAIGGEAGQIVSLIGDISGFVLSTVDSVKAVAKTGADAISNVEKAAIILTVISAAFQIAQKIASLFGDDTQAQYERAADVYKAYVDAVNEVIDAEKKLVETLTGQDRTDAYEYSIALIEKEIDAVRTLGKQYLNAGASSGFLGIGSSASNGVKQEKAMSYESQYQLYNEYTNIGLSYEQTMSLVSGRMTELFDLSADQIRKIKKLAPLYFASLTSETQGYLNDILNYEDSIKQATDDFNTTLTGISYDDMKSEFISSLMDMELNSKDIANNIQNYLRQALITNMFKKTYADQLQKYYDAFANSMKQDSEGGEEVTASERSALDAMRESIVTGATNATEKINKQFADLMDNSTDSSLTGAVKGVTEDTANILAGQMNAVRINQLDGITVMRNQLLSINRIVENTSHLAKIDRVITLLERNAGDTELRSQGLI